MKNIKKRNWAFVLYPESAEEFGDSSVILESYENGEFTYIVQDEETLELSEPVEFTEEDVVMLRYRLIKTIS